MDDLYKPIDFSAISGYPHLIPEKAIENLPCFQNDNVINARRHVQRVSHCFNKWCCNTLYEDVGMKLFILSFDDDDLDWFTKLKDKQIRTYKELTNAFMEKWKEKEPPIIKTVNSDASPDFDEKFTDVIQAMRFAHEMQLKDMEARLAEAEARIKYSDPIEPEFHNKQGKEFHLEMPKEPIDESLTGHEETKDFDLEMIEYPDNSNPHPPPEESISSEKIFDNCDDPEMISEADSLIVPVPVPISQTSDGLMTANGKLEDNFNFLTPDHYEQWLAFHHDSPMQSFIKNLQGLPNFKVWLNKEKYMFLGWYIPRKNSKLIKLGKGSSKSHPGQGLFRHLRSCFIHDMADSCSFYFSQSNSGKVKATSEQTIFKASSIMLLDVMGHPL
jgi:hypothetical protein